MKIKLKDILKEEEGLNPSEKFALKEVGEQIVQTHKRLNELLFKYMTGLKKYHSKHKDNPSVAKKIYDLWNHIKGNYYYTTKQAAGRYMLPFEKQYKKLVEGVISEGKIKFNDVKPGTKIDYGYGTIYQVTKNDGRKIYMTLRNAGKLGGLFAPKADMDKSSYESQVKVGLIKKVS